MEFFEKTRLKVGYYLLNKSNQDRNRKALYSNFSNVRKIGIVWDADHPNDFSILSKFHQKMSERNIDVTIISYYSGKELPDHLTAIRYLTCIRRNELSFFYKPTTPEADRFISEKFDVMIDLNFNCRFPLIYITAMSVASFKVGLYDSEKYPENFELALELKRPFSIEQYLEEAIRYLEMIKSE